jgi:hypothetical protein
MPHESTESLQTEDRDETVLDENLKLFILKNMRGAYKVFYGTANSKDLYHGFFRAYLLLVRLKNSTFWRGGGVAEI